MVKTPIGIRVGVFNVWADALEISFFFSFCCVIL